MTLMLMDANDGSIDHLNIAVLRRDEGGPLAKR
jgi:hypothetical protein